VCACLLQFLQLLSTSFVGFHSIHCIRCTDIYVLGSSNATHKSKQAFDSDMPLVTRRQLECTSFKTLGTCPASVC